MVRADLLPVPAKTDPYSYTFKPDDRKAKLTDLSILGVPEIHQNSKPSAQSFPQKFNEQSKSIWVSLLESKVYQDQVQVWGNLDLIWHNTIQEFLNLCEKVGVFPFDNNLAGAHNEVFKDALRRARILIVKYVNECGLFERVRVRKAFRQYSRTPNGMTVTSWADLYPLDDLGYDFEEWLQQSPSPRMYKHTNNRYVKYVQTQRVRVWVRYINPMRIRVGFDIDIEGTVQIPNAPAATRQEVDTFIDKTMLFPLIRSHRFKHVKNRLF